MNLILLFPKDYVGEKRVRLTDRRAEHIKVIHKPQLGQRLIVGLMNGLMGEGEVLSIDDTAVEMDVNLYQSPPEALPLTLLLALHRPIVLKRVLQTVAAMGVKKIFIFHSARVEKSFWNSSLLRDEEWQQHLILGLEQARDTQMPEICFRKKFKPFVEDECPALIKNSLALVAHPGSSVMCPRQTTASVTLAIGPEGGFVDYEIGLFQKIGFMPVDLGQRILRVENAISILLGRLF